jgi:putative transposase
VVAGEGLPIEVACRVLDVSCSGFYAWAVPAAVGTSGAPRLAHRRDSRGARDVDGNYGAKRVHAELVLGRASRLVTTRSRC